VKLFVARGHHDHDALGAKHAATYAFPAARGNGMSAAMAARKPRRALLAAGLGLTVVAAVALGARHLGLPPDTTPEGAYLRIALSLGRGDGRVVFSYLEDDAQHAAFTIRDYRKKARDRAGTAFPEPERARLMEEWRVHAEAPDGADVWVDLAEREGWFSRLRRDLSAVATVEVVGDRATVETARGTRYALRRRANGMWGLTLFTAPMVAEAERAARDWDVVKRSAEDYERGAR
jgi:hypothetical protein